MEKLFALLAKLSNPRIPLPLDKQAHFICGLIITAVLTPFIWWYSVIVVSMIATAKEIYDDTHKDTHNSDVWDLLFTIAGGALGYALVSLF
jgi:hypothetical protein